MNIKNKIWNEKYRPEKVENVISIHTNKILKYLENPESIPNFLFYSKIGGTGKSSMAKAIVKNLGCDVLTLNASADRSIDNIRNKVKTFAMSKSTNNLKRCIFMDEGEKLTKDAMDALKNMIEEYSSNTFYIFTTNNIEKINQPMRSRFIECEFTQPNRDEIKTFLKSICDKEDLKYEDVAIDKLVSLNYPSIRNCINKLQDLKTQALSVAITNITASDEHFNECYELIRKQEFKELHKKIMSGELNVETFNSWIFEKVIEENIDTKQQFKIINVCAKNERGFKIGADVKIIFISGLIEMMSVYTKE